MFRAFSTATALLLTTLSAPAFSQGAPDTLTIKGGSQGGSWYAISAGMTQIFAAEGVTANAELGNGLSNVMILGAGGADLALTFASVPPVALAGQAPFETPITSIRGIAMLTPSEAHLIASAGSGITGYGDLAGKSVATSTVGSSTEDLFALMRGVMGLSDGDVTLSRGNVNFDIDAVKDRTADALFVLTAAPTGSFIDLFTSNDVALVPIDPELADKIHAANDGYVKSVIPANSYPGQESDVPSISTSTMIVATADMSDDEAYWLARTLVAHLDALKATHNSLAALTPEMMAAVSGAPIHPGAAEYYREAGLLK
jgi:TRAP transporter TAXI family solute receptor